MLSLCRAVWLLNPTGTFSILLELFLKPVFSSFWKKSLLFLLCWNNNWLTLIISFEILLKCSPEAVRQPRNFAFGFSGLATPNSEESLSFGYLDQSQSTTIWNQNLPFWRNTNHPFLVLWRKGYFISTEVQIWRQRRRFSQFYGLLIVSQQY